MPRQKIATKIAAPDFELTDTNNHSITLSGFRGKPVVLVLTRGFV